MGGLTGHREELSKMRMFVVDSRGGNVFFFFWWIRCYQGRAYGLFKERRDGQSGRSEINDSEVWKKEDG